MFDTKAKRVILFRFIKSYQPRAPSVYFSYEELFITRVKKLNVPSRTQLSRAYRNSLNGIKRVVFSNQSASRISFIASHYRKATLIGFSVLMTPNALIRSHRIPIVFLFFSSFFIASRYTENLAKKY